MVKLDVAVQSKSFFGQSQQVLGQIEFSIAAGEFIAIVGPSGTGKSTLLNMIAGLECGDDATITFDQLPLDDKPPCDVSYIFQQPRLMPWLNVRDNLSLVKPDASDFEIDGLLGKVGLAGKGDVFPKHLSGGMQRRVSIARAFLTRPELLLLDEPFVSLDEPNAQRLRLLLSELCEEQKPTVVFVTHDLNEAIQLADRILFLSPSPGSVILDKKIELSRPRSEQDTNFQYWKSQLLSQYPGLLEGQIIEPVLKPVSGGFK
ncbi:ABC transporter ATP-binding protein [Neptuniibacter sp. QD29_5]|uniref:ABC transporter ATP-binding protein n=1 Tax=unclassified Neptuniibacter TaxID=2630693 RepID=UPI0039F73569